MTMSTTAEQEVSQIAPVEGSGLTGTSSSTAVATIDEDAGGNGSIAAFASQAKFLAAQRIAKALASSSLVPKQYQGSNGVANCLVAMELASRTGASVLMVMQNLHVIQGRPSWSAAFLIASINSCGRFSPIRYEFLGNESMPGWKCRAYARDLTDGDRLDGEWITWEMVTAEGWLAKSGSKWKTMPGQMMRYRAASFWARTYAPEISLGMHSAEEVADFSGEQRTTATANLNAALNVARADEISAVSRDATVSDQVAPAETVPQPTARARKADPSTSANGSVCEACGGKDGKHTQLCPYYLD